MVDPSLNPYAPTSHVSDTEGIESDVETFRRQYLAHEASIKSIGFLYLIPGILFCTIFVLTVAGLVTALLSGRANNIGEDEILGFVIGMITYGGLGSLQLYSGWGLRRFNHGAKRLAVVLSVIGLLLFPVGTVINGYFLYVLLGQKGKVVFSDEYQDAIRKTPHIKYRTSIIVKVFVGLLVALIGLGLVAALFGI